MSDAADVSELARPAAYAVTVETLRRFEAARPLSRLERFFGARPMAPEDMRWYRGVLGELAVGRLLARLGDDWRVLHSLQWAGSDTDVDHLVIGPTGVYVLNTKNHSGQKVWVGSRRILVNGQKTDHISASESEVRKLDRELSGIGAPVSATPVLVIVDPAQLTVKQRPERVRVVASRDIVRWLRRGATVLTSEQIDWLDARIRSSPAWQRGPVDADDVATRFADLDATVRRARRRRMLWLALLTAVIVGGVIAAAGVVLRML